MNETHFHAIIVGSGFGGSVMAYRLAEAGLRVCLLERGKPYPPGSFPRSPYRMRKNFWDPSEGLHGLYNFWGFRGLDALVSSGLGGGSLIYANVLIRKDMSASAYSQFRGMLMKAYSYIGGRAGFSVLNRRACLLYIGEHPRVRPLKELEIGPRPFFTAFLPSASGVLDDHFEGWFLSYEEPPSAPPEGLESVVDLGLSQEWLDPPSAPLPEAVGDRERSPQSG